MSNETKVTADGETMTIAAWARKTGIPPTTISERLKRGWPHDKAVTTPSDQYHKGQYDGKTLKQLSEESGVPMGTIYARLQRGWELSRALIADKKVRG